MKNMNLPNKLTMLRILLIPVFMLFLLLGHSYIAAVVFIVASVTDTLDGQIARRYNRWRTNCWYSPPSCA